MTVSRWEDLQLLPVAAPIVEPLFVRTPRWSTRLTERMELPREDSNATSMVRRLESQTQSSDSGPRGRSDGLNRWHRARSALIGASSYPSKRLSVVVYGAKRPHSPRQTSARMMAPDDYSTATATAAPIRRSIRGVSLETTRTTGPRSGRVGPDTSAVGWLVYASVPVLRSIGFRSASADCNGDDESEQRSDERRVSDP